jgi:integrase
MGVRLGGSRGRNTLRGYKNLLDKHILPLIGQLRVEEVRIGHCQAVVDAMGNNGLSPKTTQNAHRVLTAVFNEAVRLERRPDNPAGSRKVKTAAVLRPQLDVPNAERIRAILQAAKHGPYYVELVLAADGGLRRSELLGLGWEHVDLETGLVRIERTLYNRGQDLYFGEPKSARSRRILALTPRVVTALKAPQG